MHINLRSKIVGIWPVVAAGVVAALGSAWVAQAWMGPVSGQLREVRIEGAKMASEAALRHLIDVHRGSLVRHVDLADVERRALRHPWLRSAEARRAGQTLHLRVEERRAVALVHTDRLYLVDETGLPFLRADRQVVDLPFIFGITPEVVALHPDLPASVVRAALFLIDGLQELPVPGAPVVSEVRWSASRGYEVAFGSSRLLFGLQDVAGQLGRLRMMLEGGTLDLARPTLVDLAPRTVAIVRPLGASALPQLSSHAAR